MSKMVLAKIPDIIDYLARLFASTCKIAGTDYMTIVVMGGQPCHVYIDGKMYRYEDEQWYEQVSEEGDDEWPL